MLLKYLYDFARSRRILDDLAFSDKAIRWVIPLDGHGRLLGPGPIDTSEDGKRGKEFLAPKTSLVKGVGGIAEFLADGLTAVFGLNTDPDKQVSDKQRIDRDANNTQKYEHFWSQIADAYAQTRYAPLNALLQFHQQHGRTPPFLRYGKKEGDADESARSAWWLKTASSGEVRLGAEQFTFEIDGHLCINDDSAIRPFWREVYKRQVADTVTQAEQGVCLVTAARNVPIAPTHFPKIKGVPGGQQMGTAIVSFDKASFTSYGFEQSLNAPISFEAVAAYTNALTWLLSHDDHCIRLGDTAVVFWARESKEAAGFFARMLNRPDPKSVSDLLKAPWGGIDRTIAHRDQFYSVTVSGNGGRVTVRHWVQETLEKAHQNLAKWFSDLQVATIGEEEGRKKRRDKDIGASPATGKKDTPPLALFRLACTTVRDTKDLQPDVLTQLYRAALEGTAPSIVLVKPILDELRSAVVSNTTKKPRYPLSQSRFALLKLILNRNRKEGDPMIESKVFETDDAAYNCGRLLAILAETQAKANEYSLEGPGVAERYFGTASVSPSSVFPILLRLNRHHLNKIRKSDRYRSHAGPIEENIQNIVALFKPEASSKTPQFPRHLDLQAQGRFAIGFYQQKADSEARRAEARREKEVSAK